MNNYKIKILPDNKIIRARKGDNLAEKIEEARINLSFYCNKRGICGKCFVEIEKGILPELKEKEKSLIEQKKLRNNLRLACLYRIKNDLRIKIPDDSIILKTPILQTGIKSQILVNPLIKKYFIKLDKPEITHPYSILELIRKYFKNKELLTNVDLLRKMTYIQEKNKFNITTVIFDDKEILDIEPKDTTNLNAGIAIDVGTTTIVVELVDLNSGESIDILTEPNSQIKYGSDVISRITFALSSNKNLNELRNSVLTKLNQMIEKLLFRNNLDNNYVYEIVVAGNAPMNHFLLGTPVTSLGVSPYNAVFASLPELSSHEIGFKINKNGKVYVAPNIKSFVGGDVSAGLISSDFSSRKGNYLFIDLGTNGELVLKKRDRFITTSTAAGPAFEGMNISNGLLALPGAIYKAEYKNKLILHTIDNKAPIGICGTGIIDLIRIFLDKGEITPKGTIKNETKKIKITDTIFITQKDVREMQLAVAAVKTGIKMILQKLKLKPEDLDGIFIAGAFGNYLNIKNSIRIGLLPQIDEDKIVFIGNSSIGGAKALLLSNSARKRVESLVKKIQHFSLAVKPSFQENFIDALEFKNQSIKTN
ncbi:MAG: ASKHA domain-containing protein [Candidatus Aminicenantaceae bacterium]